MDQIKPDHIPDCEPQVDSYELMARREHLEEEIKKALDDVKREALIAQMTTTLETYRAALEAIRDGSDAICTDCGWIGLSLELDEKYMNCPECQSEATRTGADEIAAYALAQGEDA